MSMFAGARDLLLAFILGQVLAFLFFAGANPTGFGQWLASIDAGRFQHLDYCIDQYEDLEP